MIQKPKILVMTSSFPRWSDDQEISGHFVFELAKRLQKFFDVYVIAPFIKDTLLQEEIEGIKIFRFKYFPSFFGNLAYSGGILANLKKNKFFVIQIPFFFFFQLLEMRSVIKQNDIRQVHCHWLVPQGLTAAVYKKIFNRSIQIAVTVHGADVFALRGFFGSWLKKFAISSANQVSSVSTELAHRVKEIGYPREVSVFPMGIDCNHFHPRKVSRELKDRYGIHGECLLFVGRFVEKKGVQYLIKAMPKIFSSFEEAKLLLVGTGPLEEELRNLVNEMGMNEKVIFTGSVPQAALPLFFASADIFIGPSITTQSGDTEGFGLVFAEALSSETLTIASDLPAIHDIIRNNKTGFFVPEKDPGALSEKITFILKNKDKLLEVKKNARKEICERFDWEIIASKYQHWLKEYE